MPTISTMSNGDGQNTHVGELLSAYLDRALGGQDMARVEEHLGDCASCRQQLEQIRDLDLRLRRLRDFGGPAQIAPAIMNEIGVNSGEGGRISSTGNRKTGPVQPPGRFVWLARISFSTLTLALIAILGLFVMARIRELPQAPLPEASINTVSFDNRELDFHLEASSYQGIRDLTLTYWYDPNQKISQGFHYDQAQADIVVDHSEPNLASNDSPDLGRAVFFQWTLIEKSGRSTTLPVQYNVYSGQQAIQPWRAITTTHTIVYFTNQSADQIRNDYQPLIEKVYSQVSSDLGLQAKLVQSVYLNTDGRSNIYTTRMGLYNSADQRAQLALVSLQSGSSPHQLEADLARSFTYNMLQETFSSTFSSDALALLRNSLPEYMSQQYLPASPFDTALWLNTTRGRITTFQGNNQFNQYNQTDGSPLLSDIARIRDLSFTRYLIDTYGKVKLAQLLALLQSPGYSSRNGFDRAMSAIYGQSYQELYRGDSWWPQVVTQVQAIQQQRAAAKADIDVTANDPQVIWQDTAALRQLDRAASQLIWSPDGQQLLYLLPVNGNSSMYTLIYRSKNQQTGGSDHSILLDYPYPGSIRWSPDGRQLLYTRPLRTASRSENNLYIASRSQDQKIYAYSVMTVTTGYNVQNAVWLPDGNIVFSGQLNAGQNRLFIVNPATITQTATITSSTSSSSDTPDQNIRRLLPEGAIKGDEQLLAASRDGKTLAVLGQDGTRATLYIVGMDAAPQVRLVLDLGNGWVSDPSFSPDGTQLAYTSEGSGANSGIMVLNLTDGSTRHIGGEPQTGGQLDLWPSWLDNHWIVFSSTRGGGFDIYATRIDDDKVLQLSAGSSAQYLRPLVSPDGSSLVYLKLENSSTSLVEVKLDKGIFGQ